MLRLTAAPLITALAAICLSTAAFAQSAAPIDTLYRALGFDDVLEVMREEGLDYGRDMQADILGGRGGARWDTAVSGIYDTDRMAAVIRARMDADLAEADLGPMIDFFQSDRGQRIISLEVSARAALLEEGVEEMGIEIFETLDREDDPRADLIRKVVAVADLIENNVVGAMNANYAFYLGLAEGGALPGNLSEDEMLAEVWSQEPEIRADTAEWLFSYLNMAYQPLSDDDLEAYIAFYETEAGRVLNQAIFAAFDDLFTEVSYSLGSAASAFMAGEEL